MSGDKGSNDDAKKQYQQYASNIALQIEGAAGYVNKMIFMDGARFNADGTSDSLGFGLKRYEETIKDAEKMLTKTQDHPSLSATDKKTLISSMNTSIGLLRQDQLTLKDDFLDNSKLRKRAKNSLQDDLITSLTMQDSVGKAVSTDTKRAILQTPGMLDISDGLLDLVLKNPTIFTGNKSPIKAVLQPIVSSVFKPTNLSNKSDTWTIDPEKLKDPRLQKQFAEAAGKNIAAFVEIDTIMRNPSFQSVDKDTKSQITNGILSTLAKGPELNQKQFAQAAGTHVANLLDIQLNVTNNPGLNLNKEQQQKIATSLLPTLKELNLSKLNPKKIQSLTKYISKELKDHVTFASHFKKEKKISTIDLKTIGDKITKKYNELPKIKDPISPSLQNNSRAIKAESNNVRQLPIPPKSALQSTKLPTTPTDRPAGPHTRPVRKNKGPAPQKLTELMREEAEQKPGKAMRMILEKMSKKYEQQHHINEPEKLEKVVKTLKESIPSTKETKRPPSRPHGKLYMERRGGGQSRA